MAEILHLEADLVLVKFIFDFSYSSCLNGWYRFSTGGLRSLKFAGQSPFYSPPNLCTTSLAVILRKHSQCCSRPLYPLHFLIECGQRKNTFTSALWLIHSLSHSLSLSFFLSHAHTANSEHANEHAAIHSVTHALVYICTYHTSDCIGEFMWVCTYDWVTNYVLDMRTAWAK